MNPALNSHSPPSRNRSATARSGAPSQPLSSRENLPVEAWSSSSRGGERVVGAVKSKLPLPEWGADGGGDNSESDSDVEFDASAPSEPAPAPVSRASVDQVVGQLAPPAFESAEPAHGVQRELPSSGQLELQFVYGYQGLRSRGNLYFLPSGEVAFHTASLVVVYEPRGHTQRFLAGHDAEVRCLALHPQGAVLASGQAASTAGEGAAHICVWRSDEAAPLRTLSGAVHAEGGVAALAFTSGGDRLASLGGGRQHTRSGCGTGGTACASPPPPSPPSPSSASRARPTAAAAARRSPPPARAL